MTAGAETVTILFTDLVGSTELLERTGTDQAMATMAVTAAAKAASPRKHSAPSTGASGGHIVMPPRAAAYHA